MNNIKIKPGQLVPEKIRLECYARAIVQIENKIYTQTYAVITPSLCLLLPCILWELNSFREKAPNGQPWNFHDTVNMFPEFGYRFDPEKTLNNQQRLNMLHECISEIKHPLCA